MNAEHMLRNSPESAGSGSRRTFTLSESALASKNCVSRPNERSRLAEEMRVIKQKLQWRLRGLRKSGIPGGRIPNTIMISSAEPDEGKSFVSLNLALSLGFENIDVLLVDTDIANPTISNLLDIGPETGLLDLLDQENPVIEDVVLEDPKHSFAFLPSGREARVEAGLLAGPGMERVLHAMSTAFPNHLLIIDTPPLLAATEALVLSEHVSMVVLVVEANRTSESKLRAAIDLMESVPEVCILLNKAPHRHIGNRLGDYYGVWTPAAAQGRTGNSTD